MVQKKNPLKRIKFEVRPSPTSLKILLTLLIVFSMAALMALRWVHLEIQAETRAVLGDAAVLEYQNEKKADQIENVSTVQGIMSIAREELGLADPNTIFIKTN